MSNEKPTNSQNKVPPPPPPTTEYVKRSIEKPISQNKKDGKRG